MRAGLMAGWPAGMADWQERGLTGKQVWQSIKDGKPAGLAGQLGWQESSADRPAALAG